MIFWQQELDCFAQRPRTCDAYVFLEVFSNFIFEPFRHILGGNCLGCVALPVDIYFWVMSTYSYFRLTSELQWTLVILVKHDACSHTQAPEKVQKSTTSRVPGALPMRGSITYVPITIWRRELIAQIGSLRE